MDFVNKKKNFTPHKKENIYIDYKAKLNMMIHLQSILCLDNVHFTHNRGCFFYILLLFF